MVSLLVVSHSAQLAAGVKEFVDQAVHGVVKICAVGGMSDGSLGTSVDQIKVALMEASCPDGVLALVDFNSAVMSVEAAAEVLGVAVLISNAPLVEGAYLAAVEASVGASLEETAAAAMRAREIIKVYR